jgi:ornithine carbamoyltransferase
MPKQDFIGVTYFKPTEIADLLEKAIELKTELKKTGSNKPVLAGKNLAMVFAKPSLRTRVSFEVGMQQLGGHAIYISPNEVGLGTRESVKDVAKVLSGYADGIMARVFAHDDILQFAEHASVPVINGLTDFSHPCQAMADALTIKEEYGELKGKKVAFIGDGNNVARSLLAACVQLGLDYSIASPIGYELPKETYEEATSIAKVSGSTIEFTKHPKQAVKNAHVIYADTWVSMGQEDEAAERLKTFDGYQVNKELLELADPSAIVLHCLPAHRGTEITDEVMDGPQSRIFQQAENRLHAQKAILAKLLT